MDSAGFQSSLWEQVNQTAQPGIYLDQLSSIRIPVPEITEQSVIEKSLKSAQQKINSESDVLFKLRTQKSALMNDLLTGRVRVTPLLDSIGA
ncbi:restriction endonuclease subunit S [Methylomonas sp. EFPC3]|uniref:restriction endonuclease subunit S n=1 Tax=Methylomonas sp. EFPC3 TaxID=3021710 RepID=UPI0024164577|nr:restriction endonuclease subunit S [Methylomonas sp. EFPC3]WFP52381.1 restriction endonuclease subunit S [Methylomonas sp. EFPC3]